MTQTQPSTAVESLARLQIDKPGDYYIFCPFCVQDKKKCGISVRWDEGVAQTQENLSGMFHCWKCDGRGSIRKGFLFPVKGLEGKGFGLTKVDAPSVRPEDAPIEYVRCYHQVWKIYRGLYLGSPGEAYLRSRGFAAARVPAGWAPPNSSTLLDRGLQPELLRELRLIDAKGNDTLGTGGGRVVLPFSWKGRIITLYGRAVTKDSLLTHYYTRSKVLEEDGSDKARWRRGAFADRQLDKDLVILTEAPLDALALREMGVPNVCALGGTANDIVVGRIPKTAKVGIAFDDDPERMQQVRQLDGSVKSIKRSPGNDAARRLALKLGAERTFRVVPSPLPSGEKVKDWAEYLLRITKLGIPAQLPLELQKMVLVDESAVEIGISAA